MPRAFEPFPLSDGLETTDPRKHNPRSFRYLVHGIIADPALRSLQHGFLRDDSIFDEQQNIDLMSEPEKIGEKSQLSASLIDQSHTGTWGDIGFIIEAPVNNIVHMSPEDAGGGFSGIETTQRYIYSAEELLAFTGPTIYNEVVLRGTTADGQVRIIGCWRKPISDYHRAMKGLAEYKEVEALLMKIVADKNGLPFIEIGDPID